MKSTHKYLARYAEPEAALALEHCRATADNSWRYCLVIPAYKESHAFYQRLSTTLLKQHATLLILVVNQPDNLASPHRDNSNLWQCLVDATDERQTCDKLELRSISSTNSALLLVDRFSPEQQIPEKQGVGLARKIGADIALALIDGGHIERPWIYTSDADAHLPGDYFLALDGDKGKTQSAAAIYPFKHHCDDNPVGQATRLYEQRMQHYVDGLSSAGSPYAFQTIGSAIAVSASHYAQVRGFPKRSGGEDFYLLNKLAKTGPIHCLQKPEIIIEARQSDRAPFGTGPAITQLLREQKLDAAEIFYHPQIFVELEAWLKVMPLTQTQDLDDLTLSILTLQALQTLGTAQAIAAARKISTSAPSYSKQLHSWFDAFKTLKFVHYLRDNQRPNVCIRTLESAGNH